MRRTFLERLDDLIDDFLLSCPEPREEALEEVAAALELKKMALDEALVQIGEYDEEAGMLGDDE